MKINKSDICTGGINCKHGLHIKDLNNFIGNIPEAVTFEKNNFSLIDFLRKKKNLFNKKNIKFNDLINSFLFDVNLSLNSKRIDLNPNYKKSNLIIDINDKIILESGNKETEEYELSLIKEVLSSVEKKMLKCYTPSRFDSVMVNTDEIEFISRPNSISPMMNLRKDILKSPDELSDISENSFLNLAFSINDMISCNTKYIESV